MGEFENLIERVREGDTEAIDELEQNFGGSTLRQQYEEAKSWRDKNIDRVRKAAFDEVVSGLEEDLRTAVSLDEFQNVDPDELTPDAVKARATENLNQRRAAKLAAAKDAGFESVEEYEEALQAVKQAKEKRANELGQVGSAAASGGGAGDGVVSTFDEAKGDFNKAKELGATTDEAMGEAVHTILARQAPVEVPE